LTNPDGEFHDRELLAKMNSKGIGRLFGDESSRTDELLDNFR
jgi:hypothetical protein